MNETIKTIHELRTIHGNFSDKKISDTDIDTIINCAVRAANASARQSYSIIVVSDKEKIKQLTEYTGDKLLVFCVDFTRIIDLAEHMGYKFAVDDILGFITGSTDTILAAQTACIAAKSLGIDSLFTQRGLHRRDISKAFKILELPDKYCFPLVGLILGYSDVCSESQRGRLSGKGILHWKTYHRLTDNEKDQLIFEYDDKSKNLGLIFGDSYKDGIKHYLDWFYSKWSIPRPAEKARLYSAIRKAGFLPES